MLRPGPDASFNRFKKADDDGETVVRWADDKTEMNFHQQKTMMAQAFPDLENQSEMEFANVYRQYATA